MQTVRLGVGRVRLAFLGMALLAWGGCADLPSVMATEGSSGGTTGAEMISSEDGDTSSVDLCGNDVVDGEEQCDGSDLAGADCLSQGLGAGRLSCSEDCTYEVSGCAFVCGNGIVEDSESCDGDELAGEDCISQGYASGTLSCASDCTVDTSDCSEYVGDCCVPNITPGCEDPACSAAVCATNPFCCDQAWDSLCVGIALAEVACQSVGGSCPELGDCCVEHGSPGCEDPGCTAAICDLRPSCCSEPWSAVCAGAASNLAACQGVGGSCPVSVCGDEFADATEVCDGVDLVGEDCTTQADFQGGALACLDDCSGFDTSACADYAGECCTPHVGPGCDDPKCTAAVCALNPFCCDVIWDNLCAEAAAMELACFGTVTCPPDDECGDGVAQTGEVCDSADLNLQNCATQGYEGGELACSDDCSAFDTDGCGNFEGDCCEAHAAPGCDDSACTAAICAIDAACCVEWSDSCAMAVLAEPACEGTAAICLQPNCGNDLLDIGEVCDGSNLAGMTCGALGFASGTLGCQDDCSGFDTSGCQYDGHCCQDNGTPGCNDNTCAQFVCENYNSTCCSMVWNSACALHAINDAPLACHGLGAPCPGVVCGNDQTQVGEVCDGGDVNGETCMSQGFGGGELACQASCLGFDTSGCWTGECCAANPTPGCEDSLCATSVCGFDPFCCDTLWDSICADEATVDPDCNNRELPSCPNPECGDNFAEGKEVCDGTDLVGQDCISQGFGGGTLGCASGCSGFDTSACFAGDCCDHTANGTPGCADAECTAAICAMGEAGAACCEGPWTASCAAAAAMEPACQGVGGSCPL